MADDLKRKAAKHSVEAFALLRASRLLRQAAIYLDEIGAKPSAAEARKIAKRVDAHRRAVMAIK